MKRKLAALTTSGLLVIALAACSDDAEEPTTDPTSVETVEPAETETEEVELDEAEAQQGAADKLNDYYTTLMADNESVYAESPIFEQEEAPPVSELVEFAEGPGSIVMDHYYLDDDFTDNEVAVLALTSVMANGMMNAMSGAMDEAGMEYTIDADEVIIERNTAEITPQGLTWTVNGEVQEMDETESGLVGMASSSYLIYVDGEWYIDGRATLDESLSQGGDITVEDLLAQMGVEAEETE